MHDLSRNRQDIWFANPTGEFFYLEDENGNKTGEKEVSYKEPVKTKMSMATSSGANNLGSQGMAELKPYGITTGYTHRAVTYDMNCEMNEESRVWYGIEPFKVVNNQTVAVPHNFMVVRKSPSLNHITYYLKEVDVT